MMMSSSEPASSPRNQRGTIPTRIKVLIGLSALAAIVVIGLLTLRSLGLIRVFSVPAGGMMPAISPGDHVAMEGFTFLTRDPRRGDVIVFKTDGIPQVPQDQIYVKRVAGVPGDRLRIEGGKLYVNETRAALRNATGEIEYVFVFGSIDLASPQDAVTVPEGHYFVLGDNSGNSADSRHWGFMPAENIMGRSAFCYWPPKRIGAVD